MDQPSLSALFALRQIANNSHRNISNEHFPYLKYLASQGYCTYSKQLRRWRLKPLGKHVISPQLAVRGDAGHVQDLPDT